MDEGTLPDFAEAVLDVVDAVPAGKVTTYGRVAALLAGAGLRGGGPRAVGAVLSRYGAAVPWWRVCPVDGRPGAHPEEARRRWSEEGTPLRGRVGEERVDVDAALAELRLPEWVGR
ncbi:MGMT family protein [Aquipuribacter sp. SD81]|uniref:MGMT family protein n=1 Tax=Aquipuribacter sp. SD81 TaxID=3127703 RepID=UPI00301A3B08